MIIQTRLGRWFVFAALSAAGVVSGGARGIAQTAQTARTAQTVQPAEPARTLQMPQTTQTGRTVHPPQTASADPTVWRPLFDGTSLGAWQPSKFARGGAISVQNRQIVLEPGGALTGITWAGEKLPSTRYELALEAMRIEGSDFFAGITFPVGEEFCSLILGGWGGTTVGLSSLNGRDASENDTSQSIDFESGRWYKVRIRVTPDKIEAWLDERQIVSQSIAGVTVSTRIEVEPSHPLGIASYRTKAALREIRLRQLEPPNAR